MHTLNRVIIVIILLIAFLSYMDVRGMEMWKGLGGFDSEAYKKSEPQYMSFFWTFAIMLGIVAAIIYYIFTKDLSETIAIISVYLILIWSGLEDILFYKIQGMTLDASMPWLMNNVFISTIAKIQHETTVTPSVLISSVIIGVVISILIFKFLRRQKW